MLPEFNLRPWLAWPRCCLKSTCDCGWRGRELAAIVLRLISRATAIDVPASLRQHRGWRAIVEATANRSCAPSQPTRVLAKVAAGVRRTSDSERPAGRRCNAAGLSVTVTRWHWQTCWAVGIRCPACGIHPRHTAAHVGRVGWLRRFAGSIRACHKWTCPNHGVHANTVACHKMSCARLQARRRGRPARWPGTWRGKQPVRRPGK